jgi:ABC-type nitrate/sulfonate/bicarbonate transport system substrate-binding protein
MNRKWDVITLAIITIAMGGVGCEKKHSKATDLASANATVVRIAYLPIYVDLPVFVAKERGFFANHGVNVELVRFSSSPEIGTALLTGRVNFGASVGLPVVLSAESRDPGRLAVFIVDCENKENYLTSFVTMPNSGIKSLVDLKGKTVGSFPGPTSVPFCKLLLRQAGLDPQKDVKLVELEVSTHISALSSGTVDALFTYEPTATQAVLEKGATNFMPGAVERNIISPWMGGVWVVSTDFAKVNPNETKATIAALYDAIRYIRSSPVGAKAALKPYTSIKEEIAAATPNIPFSMLPELDVDSFQKNADLYLQFGLSKKIDVHSILAPRPWTAP